MTSDRKLCESTMRISPPVVRLVGAIASILKVYWIGDCTFCPPTAALSSANDFRSKVMRVDDAYFAAGGSPGRRHRFHFEGVLDRRLHFLPANCCLIFCQ